MCSAQLPIDYLISAQKDLFAGMSFIQFAALKFNKSFEEIQDGNYIYSYTIEYTHIESILTSNIN